jgi:hypothetical protein
MSIVVCTIWGMKSHDALRYEEGLVVHLVPVCWRASGIGWKREFGGAYAVV